MMHSSTRPGSMPARRTASRMTIDPSCGAVNSLREPRNFPVGRRTAERMTLSIPRCYPPPRRPRCIVSTRPDADRRGWEERMDSELIIVPSLFFMIGYIVHVIVDGYRRRQQMRVFTEFHSKLLERLGSANEFAEFF